MNINGHTLPNENPKEKSFYGKLLDEGHTCKEINELHRFMKENYPEWDKKWILPEDVFEDGALNFFSLSAQKLREALDNFS